MNTAIKIMEMQQDENNNLIFNLTLISGAELENLEVEHVQQLPELRMDFKEKPINDTNLIEKNSIKKVHDEYSVEDEFELAKNLSSQGKNREAGNILEKLLSIEPEYVAGRNLLATIFYEQGNFEKANMVLTEGLMQRPLYPPYVQLKAEILADEGKLKEALHLLQKAPPAIDEYPDYHALVAALYQRLGKSTLAEGLYEQLLRVDARNSRWWVGLGIARESQNKKPEALIAFSKASMISTLSPELRNYVESRISSLQ
jgi:MSHA biogenesis protein MshN